LGIATPIIVLLRERTGAPVGAVGAVGANGVALLLNPSIVLLRS
jgi:hypothetical protein